MSSLLHQIVLRSLPASATFSPAYVWLAVMCGIAAVAFCSLACLPRTLGVSTRRPWIAWVFSFLFVAGFAASLHLSDLEYRRQTREIALILADPSFRVELGPEWIPARRVRLVGSDRMTVVPIATVVALRLELRALTRDLRPPVRTVSDLI